jgi:alanyl-tRNA synthetase
MSEEQIKKAYDFAQKEIATEKTEKLQKLVKDLVQTTLNKIEKLEEQIKKLNEEKKTLKQTIDDLKEGKMDLLKEKLEKDPQASDWVKIKIVEVPVYIERTLPVNPWYKQWDIVWESPVVTCGSNNVNFIGAAGTTSQISKAVLGTYCTSSGHTVTLR